MNRYWIQQVRYAENEICCYCFDRVVKTGCFNSRTCDIMKDVADYLTQVFSYGIRHAFIVIQ